MFDIVDMAFTIGKLVLTWNAVIFIVVTNQPVIYIVGYNRHKDFLTMFSDIEARCFSDYSVSFLFACHGN